MKISQRKFGQIPHWAKTGPITAKNYSYRAEAHCAARNHDRNGEHPTINRDSPDLESWRQYFDLHLGRRPLAFVLLMEGKITEMTVPEPVPQWFDKVFAEAA